MSFLHSHSAECHKSELELFSVLPTQVNVENSYYCHYSPVSSLTQDSNIEYSIPGNLDEYVDLSHSLLSVKVQIVPEKEDTKEADLTNDANDFGVINNFCSSLFSSVDVALNQKTVSSASSHYAYRAYLECLLNYSSDARKSHLTTGLWYDDDGGQMDQLHTLIGTTNKGLQARREHFKDAAIVDLLAPIHADIFNSDKFLLNNVDISLRFVKNKSEFLLMQSADSLQRKVVIRDMSVIMRRVKVSPSVILNHGRLLSNNTCKYNLTRVEIKTFTLAKGAMSQSVDNAVLGLLPKRVTIFFVTNKAFNGSRQHNPYNFQHFSLNYLSLMCNGTKIPSTALTPNFEKKNFIRCFHSVFSGSGCHYSDCGTLINRDNYDKGYAVFCFDLSSDMSASCGSHFNLSKTGNLKIELGFAKPLSETINLMMHAEFDSILEIDQHRQVSCSDFAS